MAPSHHFRRLIGKNPMVLHGEQNHAQPPHAHLSEREDKVMRLLALGKTTKEVAALLFLCRKTVSTYRKRILKKIKLSSNSEVIRYAVQHGLIVAASKTS